MHPMIEQSIRYECDGCSREEYSDCGNPFDWVDDKSLCRKCSKLKPMNNYKDYLALKEDFANKLRFIFPSSTLKVEVEISGVKEKDFNVFVGDAPCEGRVSTRTLFKNFEFNVFELENGDEINTL